MNNTTQNNSWTQHPKGLPFLTATELWERFAFYIVQGLLVLYVVYQFHWTDSRSYSLAGAYSALVYMSPLLGGYLADHIIGQTKALLIGGVILIIGYGTLAMGTQLSMIAGLSAVILGNGLYKPNVSTLVGNLYPKSDNSRESGYTLFFVGFNVGGTLADFSIGFIKELFGWEFSFALAAFGIVIAVAIFLYGRRYVIDSFDARQISGGERPKSIPWLYILLSFLAVIGMSMIFLYFSSLSNLLFIFIGLCLIIYLIWLIKRFDRIQAQKFCLLLLLMVISVLFWGLYFEEFLSVNLFIDRVVNRDVLGHTLPATFFLGFEPFFVVTVGLYFAHLLKTSPYLNISILSKFICALGCMVVAYSILTLGTLMPESSGKVSFINTVIYFLFTTLGQLFLYPIGMAAVLKLSPKHMQGFMMGVWFFTLGLGGSVGGLLGNLARIDATELASITTERLTYQYAFVSYALIALLAVVILLIFRPLLRKFIGNTIDT